MNGINRRGQKVVCVAEVTVIVGDISALRKYDGPAPRREAVYTVDGFIESVLLAGPFGTVPGIALMEIPCVLKPPGMQPMGWPIAAFRPLDQRETDISELRKLATPVTEPV